MTITSPAPLPWKRPNVRQLFAPDEAEELLELDRREQVDALAGRGDRLVSDLLFAMIGRLDTIATDSQKKSYDQVVKVILQRLGIDRIEATEHLMGQALFRHILGEPLALGVPHWWNNFLAKYAIGRSRRDPIAKCRTFTDRRGRHRRRPSAPAECRDRSAAAAPPRAGVLTRTGLGSLRSRCPLACKSRGR